MNSTETLTTPELAYRIGHEPFTVVENEHISLPTETQNLSVRCAVRGGPDARIRWECSWTWKNKTERLVDCTEYTTKIKEKVPFRSFSLINLIFIKKIHEIFLFLEIKIKPCWFDLRELKMITLFFYVHNQNESKNCIES